jgi:hypothetical protein
MNKGIPMQNRLAPESKGSWSTPKTMRRAFCARSSVFIGFAGEIAKRRAAGLRASGRES